MIEFGQITLSLVLALSFYGLLAAYIGIKHRISQFVISSYRVV